MVEVDVSVCRRRRLSSTVENVLPRQALVIRGDYTHAALPAPNELPAFARSHLPTIFFGAQLFWDGGTGTSGVRNVMPWSAAPVHDRERRCLVALVPKVIVPRQISVTETCAAQAAEFQERLSWLPVMSYARLRFRAR